MSCLILADPYWPELADRGDVRQPAEVVAGSQSGKLHRTELTEVGARGQAQREAGAPPGRQLRVTWRRLYVACGRSESRGVRAGGPHRLVVGNGDRGEHGRRRDRGDHAQPDPRQQPMIADRLLPVQATRDPETGEQARGEERDQPRIRCLEGRQERLGSERHELVDHADDRRHEEQQGDDADPHDDREREVSARDRRPDDTGDRDPDGKHRHQPDDDVEGAARTIGQEDETGRDRPRGDEGDAKKAELEPADPHVRSLPSGARLAAWEQRSGCPGVAGVHERTLMSLACGDRDARRARLDRKGPPNDTPWSEAASTLADGTAGSSHGGAEVVTIPPTRPPERSRTAASGDPRTHE